MYERKHQQLATRLVFLRRLFQSCSLAGTLIAISLSIGIMGYHWIAGFDYVNSLLEASMILGGMGPVNPLHDDEAKIFASIYALFSGLIFIAIMGIILTPITHRMLHKFHMDDGDVKP